MTGDHDSPGHPSHGHLYGVGLGPGDPELVTVRASKLLANAQVIAYHCASHGRSIARATAAPYLSEGVIEEKLVYPVTTGGTDHPGGYAGALADFYTESAARLAVHLEAGRDVVVLCEGDPAFYGSYQHLHSRLAGRFEATIVPGVPSISAAAAAAGVPLVMHEEVLVVAPGTLDGTVLAGHLEHADAAAVFKLGRTFSNVRYAVERAGLLDRALYVERAGTVAERVGALDDIDPDSVPYMSLALIPGTAGSEKRSSRRLTDEATAAETSTAAGSVIVVGLGPGDDAWTTPEVRSALESATDLVGYTTYLARVPERRGQQRHGSDNKVESERAAMALDLAARGHRVVVVSSGDPGVFAMASAVVEVAAERGADGPAVTVLPGVTAAQAVAARVGAPLGHDYAVLSLSDRLKPWSVIEERLDAAAAADFALAIYNPASRDRQWQVNAARDVLLRHRKPDTPVVVARDVGGPTETISVIGLAELAQEMVDMRTLLIVGSSATRTFQGPGGAVVFTPRRHGS